MDLQSGNTFSFFKAFLIFKAFLLCLAFWSWKNWFFLSWKSWFFFTRVIPFVLKGTLSKGLGGWVHLLHTSPHCNFVRQSWKMKPCSAGTQSSIWGAEGSVELPGSPECSHTSPVSACGPLWAGGRHFLCYLEIFPLENPTCFQMNTF